MKPVSSRGVCRRRQLCGVVALAISLLPEIAAGQPAQGPGAALPAEPPEGRAGSPGEEPPRLVKPAREEARKLVREGAELYEQNDRVGAVGKFEDAYAIYPAPEILFNLGLAYVDVGRNAAAHRALAGFLENLGFPDEARLRQAEQAVHQLEPLVGRLLIRVPYRDGALVRVDRQRVGVAPLDFAIAVEPGVHEVTALVEGKEVVYEQVAAGPGELVRVKLWRARGQAIGLPVVGTANGSGRDVLADPLAKSAPTPLYKRWWLWTAVGAVAAGAVLYLGRGEVINDVDPSLGRYRFDQF